MECLHARVSYAQWRLSTLRQLLATSQPSTARVFNRKISTSRPNHLNDVAPEQGPGTTDRDSVPPSQQLPQSPLITNPRHGAGRIRKRRPSHEETLQLSKNPWAVALASPTRMCAVTNARLPSDLLGTWGLVRQPGLETAWMMPVRLMQDSLQDRKTKPAHQEVQSASAQDEDQSSEAKMQDPDEDESSVGFTPPVIRSKQPTRQLVLRIAELLPLIRSISVPLSKKNRRKPAIMRLLPFRWKHPQGPVTANEEKNIFWPENAPDILLQAVRADVCKKLGAVLGKYKRVGTPNGVWRALDVPEYSDAAIGEALKNLEPFDRMSCGSVLLLGSRDPAPVSLNSSILAQTGSNVPVFDLSVLLSKSDLQTLRESHGQFESHALFFRPEEQLGIDAMLSLWKIKRLLSGVDHTGN